MAGKRDEISAAILSLAMLAGLDAMQGQSLTALAVANFLPIFLGSITNAALVRRLYGVNVLSKIDFRPKQTLGLLKSGIMLASLQLLLGIQFQTDILVASNSLSMVEFSSLAFYSRFAGPIFVLCSTLLVQDWGIVARLYGKNEISTLRKIIKSQINTIVKIHLALGISLWLFFYLFLESISGGKILLDHFLIVLLIISSVISSINYSIVFFSSITDKIQQLVGATFLATFSLYVFKYKLAKSYGGEAMVGLGSMLLICIQTIPTMWLISKSLKLPRD